MKASDYVIVKKHADRDCYITINSLSGNVDYLSNQVGTMLVERNLKEMTEEQGAYLYKRGYIVEEETDEVERLRRISELIHKKNLKKMRLSIAPTTACNFACEYCFEGTIKRNTKTFHKEDIDELFQAVDKAGKPFDRNVFLFGGEPLLKNNKELVSYIVNKCQERKMVLYGPTNGYDLDVYHDLLGKEKINNLQITIDGSREVHNASRKHVNGSMTFDKIVSNIDYCLENDISIIARTNLSKETISEALKLQEFYCKKNWISNKNFNYSFSPVFYLEDSMTYPELFENLHEMGISEKILIDHVSEYLGISRKLKSLVDYDKLVIFQPEGCMSCHNSFIVTPDKKLYTCGNLLNTEMYCGELVEGKFAFNDLHNEWNNRYNMNMTKCSKCPYSLYCGGSCAAICLKKNVSIYTSLCNSYGLIFNKCLSHLESEKIPYVI